MSTRKEVSKRRGLWAVVPVKPFARTKGRLAPILSRDEHEPLAGAMLTDVLSALTKARSLAGVVIVTGDSKAAQMARKANAHVIHDAENTGTTAAVAKAARHLAEAGCDGMLVVPADIPQITAADIDAIVAAHQGMPAVTLVQAAIDGGTNALACSPPEAIRFCFGDDSFRQHRDAAKTARIVPAVLKLSRLEQDIDRPDDLAEFMTRPSKTRSYACLAAAGVTQRLWTATADS
jgi:2-phospho-L-lactate/phosphoenolpyruvate guanylyltransferase